MSSNTTKTATPAPAGAVRYNPERLLDAVTAILNVKNDAALARALEVAGPVIHRIRRRHTPVRASILMRMQDASGIPIGELRAILGDKRKTFRML